MLVLHPGLRNRRPVPSDFIVTEKLQPKKGSPYYTRVSAESQESEVPPAVSFALPERVAVALANIMLFISFEGLDGSGKTTQVDRLMKRLKDEGHKVLALREPGGTPLSERVRDVLLDANLDIDAFAELLLFSAARAQLVRRTIRPALAEGQIVICDRFFDSTTAYQGGGRRLESVEWLNDFHRHVTGGLVPRRTYYCRLDPEEAARRRGIRNSGSDSQDRMELSGESFFGRVGAAYDRIAQDEPERFVVVNASRSIEEIEQDIWRDVSRLLHPA